jgi:hypothetical protein
VLVFEQPFIRCSLSSVLTVSRSKDKTVRLYVSGTQLVSKFKDGKDKANTVHILIAVVRLPAVSAVLRAVCRAP